MKKKIKVEPDEKGSFEITDKIESLLIPFEKTVEKVFKKVDIKDSLFLELLVHGTISYHFAMLRMEQYHNKED